MKKVIFNLILFFVGLWALMSLGFFVLRGRQGEEAYFIAEAVSRLPISIFVLLMMIWSMRWVFPSLRYLEKNSTEKPIFKRKQVRSFEIDVPSDFDFNFLKTKIAEKWVITFSDDAGCVLKFREKWKFMDGLGGLGTWIKYDNTTQKLYLESFCAVGKRIFLHEAQELQKEIANCVGIDIFEEED